MNTTTKPCRAVLYTRVSTMGQADNGTSLDEQLAACTKKAKELGAQIVAHEEDAGVSGAAYQSRDGIQNAIAAIERGDADTLIIANLSRFSRDREHQSAIQKRVKAAGGRLVFCDMDFADTPEGDLAFGILGSFADYERKVIRERTIKGRRHRAANDGQQVSRSMRPYGYIIVTKAMVLAGEWPAEDLGKYKIHPQEGPWVTFMFERYAAGDSLRQVALALHRKGIPTARGGKEWEPETISGILRNPVHKGEPTFGREERVTDESRRERGMKSTYYNRPRPADQVIILSAPPLVSPETWQKANDRMDFNKEALRGRRDRRWFLTGILRCARCGMSMKGHPINNRNPYAVYTCPHYSPAQTARRVVCDRRRFPALLVEGKVVEAIEWLSETPESVENAFQGFAEEDKKASEECGDGAREKVQADLAALTRKEAAAIDAQIAGVQAGADPSAYAKVFADIRQERERLKRRLADLGGGKTQTGPERDWKAEAQALVASLSAFARELLTAPDLSPAEKHGLLSRLIARIVIEGEEGDDEGGLRLRMETHGDLTVAVIQMALAVGDALMVAEKPYTVETLEKPLREAFVTWLDSPENTRAPGFTCISACRRLKEGRFWWDATVLNSKGCGANMRVQPVGLLKDADASTRAGIAQFQAALTHGHPTALAASDLTAFTIAYLADGGEPGRLLESLFSYALRQRTVYHADWLGPLWQQPGQFSPEGFMERGWVECLDVLGRVSAALEDGDRESDPCLATGEGWVAEEAFATALLCFLFFSEDPVATVRRAAVTSGDSDSLACIAGAFAGARHGASVWPAEWRRDIEYRDPLERLAQFLA